MKLGVIYLSENECCLCNHIDYITKDVKPHKCLGTEEFRYHLSGRYWTWSITWFECASCQIQQFGECQKDINIQAHTSGTPGWTRVNQVAGNVCAECKHVLGCPPWNLGSWRANVFTFAFMFKHLRWTTWTLFFFYSFSYSACTD